MALDAFATGDGNMWLASGGDWFFELNETEQQEAIDLLLNFITFHILLKSLTT
ncbi:serine/threonine-specific protein phosphatase 2 [Escherichia coli]|uniref:Serine/threonine-specific protein phosphatase 2 n=1 Tax=Escherichia coli TaxID=562 RepID=A0A377D8I1_ECOLX|nr:serine/threonine-specific protein phosphatase 2 [Escherichia coli]